MSDMYPFTLRLNPNVATKVEIEQEWKRLSEARWDAIRANDRGSIDAFNDSMNKLANEYQRRFGEDSQSGVEEIRSLIVESLYTDGGHHKQWYLERIAEKLGIDMPELRRECADKYGYPWESGIAP